VCLAVNHRHLIRSENRLVFICTPLRVEQSGCGVTEIVEAVMRNPGKLEDTLKAFGEVAAFERSSNRGGEYEIVDEFVAAFADHLGGLPPAAGQEAVIGLPRQMGHQRPACNLRQIDRSAAASSFWSTGTRTPDSCGMKCTRDWAEGFLGFSDR
jgi:hypothetical protein